MTIPKHQLRNPNPLVDKGDAVPMGYIWVTYITGAQSRIHEATCLCCRNGAFRATTLPTVA